MCGGLLQVDRRIALSQAAEERRASRASAAG